MPDAYHLQPIPDDACLFTNGNKASVRGAGNLQPRRLQALHAVGIRANASCTVVIFVWSFV